MRKTVYFYTANENHPVLFAAVVRCSLTWTL